MTIPVDPIVASVIQHRLLAIVEEMGEAMLPRSDCKDRCRACFETRPMGAPQHEVLQ